MKQRTKVRSFIFLVLIFSIALPGSAGILPALSPQASGMLVPSVESGGEDEIEKGFVIQSLPTKADPKQTYALFLPPQYSSGKKWPVLICFDPSARGYLPVECFRQAAEKYGYIVAGSNISRNGPMEPSQMAAQAVLYDIVERFSIDEMRLYMTGFSGGARVACRLAHLMKGRVAGVIGCAAGFSEDLDPSADTPFAFCGTVGFEDYNFLEMRITDRNLAKLGLPHHLLYFEGGHSWPPPVVATEAIEWLEAEAMKAGRRPQDLALAQTLAETMIHKAEREEAQGSLPDAVRACQSLVDTFQGLIDVGAAQDKAASLMADKEYRKEAKRERELEDQELTRMGEIRGLIAGLQDQEQRVALFQTLRGLMASLEGRTKDTRNRNTARQARRLLDYVSITAFYAAEPLIDAKQYNLAALLYQIQAEIHPETASIQIRLARALAYARDRKKTLAALKRAAENGYSNRARLEEDPAFEFLRPDQDFRQLVEAIQNNQQKAQ